MLTQRKCTEGQGKPWLSCFSWEQRKLGELVQFSKGTGYSKADLKESGTPIILYGRLYTKYETVIADVDTFADAKPGSVYSHGGEVIVPASGETAEDISIASVVEKSGVLLGGDLNIITPTGDLDPAFLAISISNGKPHDDMAKMAQGKSVVHLHNTDLEKIDLAFPSHEEQLQISSCFKRLDNLITLHQRQINLVQSNGVQNTHSWEQRKLSEVADKVTEKNVNLAVHETFTNSAEYGVISQRDFFDHDISNAENIGGYYVVRNEDFVYNPRISVTAPVGPVNRNKLGRNGVMSPLYTVFRAHDIDTTYLEWFFKSSYWHPFMFFNGDSGARSDRFSIKDAVFFEMPIPTPSLAEQRRIGAYIDKLDNLITLHQREHTV